MLRCNTNKIAMKLSYVANLNLFSIMFDKLLSSGKVIKLSCIQILCHPIDEFPGRAA